MADGGFKLPNSKPLSAVFFSKVKVSPVETILLSPLDSPTAVTRAELRRVSPASAVHAAPAAAKKKHTEAEEEHGEPRMIPLKFFLTI